MGYLTAEEIKCTIGSAVLREEETAMVANGKSIVSGMPLSFEINSTEVYYAIKDELDHILQGTLQVLERTPPELMSDIMDTGLTLTGGVPCFTAWRRCSSVIRNRYGYRFYEPQYCVARGRRRSQKCRYSQNQQFCFKSGRAFGSVKHLGCLCIARTIKKKSAA